MTDAAEYWEERVGRIRVFEHVRRKRVLYLRWRHEGNWAYHSLKPAAERDGFPTATLLDVDGQPLTGRALDRKKKWAIEQAEMKLAELRSGAPAPAIEKAKAPLTLDETWSIISDPETGHYPVDSKHRREVKRELESAIRILGGEVAWTSINRSMLTKLWRTRIRELRATGTEDEQTVGLRGTEITLSRLLAIATWLRDREHIPADAVVAPSSWRKDLRNDWLQITGEDRVPEPERPRHTPDEYRKLFSATWDVDPRMGLMYALGAELRGGQVKRARRSDLELPPITAENAAIENYGRFKSPGRGKKKGTEVLLTKAQRAAVDRALDPESGYLRELEAAHQRGELADYFLFPAGQLPGNRTARGVLPVHPNKREQSPATRDPRTPAYPVATVERHTKTHIEDSAIRKWFKRAEAKAGIKSIEGRVWYGARRVGVDAAKESGISREGLQEHGGWTDSQVPDSIYADKDREYARKEAAKVRSKIRGENE